MKKITTLLCILLLTGCSTKFAYNNADWLVYWYLDDYIELNNQQEDMFDEMLANWQTWHRQNELPKYQSQLAMLASDIDNDTLTVERVAFHRDSAREHWVRAREHVANDIVTLAKTLNQEQVIYLFAALEKENVEDEEEMLDRQNESETKRNTAWIKRNQKNIKRWLGKLSPEQETFIASFRQRFESTGEHWLDYKRVYQQALREVFAMDSRGTDFEARLYELIVNPEKYRSDAFLLASEANMRASSDYFVGLINTSNNKQIKKLLNEIDDFYQDVVSLQGS